MPGVFSWHVKSLFLKGQYNYEYAFTKYSLDILTFTWFFSSLYLIYLYLILFLKPMRLASRNAGYLSIAKNIGARKFSKSANSFTVRALGGCVSAMGNTYNIIWKQIIHFLYLTTPNHRRISWSFF